MFKPAEANLSDFRHH